MNLTLEMYQNELKTIQNKINDQSNQIYTFKKTNPLFFYEINETEYTNNTDEVY